MKINMSIQRLLLLKQLHSHENNQNHIQYRIGDEAATLRPSQKTIIQNHHATYPTAPLAHGKLISRLYPCARRTEVSTRAHNVRNNFASRPEGGVVCRTCILSLSRNAAAAAGDTRQHKLHMDGTSLFNTSQLTTSNEDNKTQKNLRTHAGISLEMDARTTRHPWGHGTHY